MIRPLAFFVVCFFCLVLTCVVPCGFAQESQPPASSAPQQRTLDSYFPFQPPQSLDEWAVRRECLRKHIMVSLGLWPLPTKTPLNAVVHGPIDCGDYAVQKVYFESLPGFYVTGNLYRPKNLNGPAPGVLCPHGHWRNGRFLWSSDDEIRREIASGGEKNETNARSVLQSRCASLARLGCIVFHYDMIGYADSQQISYDVAHGFKDRRPEMESPEGWGLFSPAAELRLQSVMGLQTWNSIRALDFLEALPDVDRTRIGVTGASGGGTQTFILCAIDPRPSVAFPAVMVSTAMQGGCTCENCCLLRIGAGNVDFAAMFAPKPQGLTAADDWTKDMETKGFPELRELYRLMGKENYVHLTARTEFGHNYNLVSREAMYDWFNRHLQLNNSSVAEQPVTTLPPEQLTVFDDQHPRPPGGPEFEKQLLHIWDEDSRRQLSWDAVRTVDDQRRLSGLLRTAFKCLVGDSDSGSSISWSGSSISWELPQNTPTVLRATGTLKSLSVAGDFSVVQLESTASAPVHARRTVIVLMPNGCAGLDSGQSSLPRSCQKLIDRGYEVIVPDLIYRGAMTDPTNPLGENRLVPNDRRAAAYTFGYNPPTISRQAGQIIELIRAIDRDSAGDACVCLIGCDEMAPVACLAASVLDHHQLDELAVCLDGFRFENLTEFEDPRFLPGIVKYGGLDGCLSVAPSRHLLVLLRPTAPVLSATCKSYTAACCCENLCAQQIGADASADASVEALVDHWLCCLDQR